MITVQFIDDQDGVRVTAEGHAAPDESTRVAVCAGVSTLMRTLIELTGSGTFGGDKSGHMCAYVPAKHLPVMDFVLVGFYCLRAGYPGNIIIHRRDTRLKPESTWNIQ